VIPVVRDLEVQLRGKLIEISASIAVLIVISVMPSLAASKPARTSSSEKRKWRGACRPTPRDIHPYSHEYSLRKLKEKLAAQRKHLDELDSHIKELESERGGEQ
jgi:hypothetical protein